MKRTRFIVGGLLCVGFIATVGMPADATTNSNQTGAACQELFDQTSPTATHIEHDPVAVYHQDTLSHKYVTCPMTRRNTLTTTGLSGGNVYINDTSPSGTDFKCGMNSYDLFGNLVSGTGWVTSFSRHNISLPGITSTSSGYYAIACDMPAAPTSTTGPFLWSYDWYEN